LKISNLISVDLFLHLKRERYINSLSEIEFLHQNKHGPVTFKAGDIVIKTEPEWFLTKYYSDIKKLSEIDKKYIISDYRFLHEPNFFCYTYIDGIDLDVFCNYDISDNNSTNKRRLRTKQHLKNKHITKDSITDFIKFYISIDINDLSKGRKATIPYIHGDKEIHRLRKQQDKDIFHKSTFMKNLNKIYDISTKNQKSTNKTLLRLRDLSTHNILIKPDGNIKILDLSDGLVIGNFNLNIHRYFSLLWGFGEKAVDAAIRDCNIDNDSLFVKELSFFYFYLKNTPIGAETKLFWFILNHWHGYDKICKKLLSSLKERYPGD
jgi:hypothetical protein